MRGGVIFYSILMEPSWAAIFLVAMTMTAVVVVAALRLLVLEGGVPGVRARSPEHIGLNNGVILFIITSAVVVGVVSLEMVRPKLSIARRRRRHHRVHLRHSHHHRLRDRQILRRLLVRRRRRFVRRLHPRRRT